jgi:catalase
MEPAEAVDAINVRFGRHPGRRALHSAGTWCRGTFTATPQAAARCRAAHLQGDPVPVLARLSNGASHPRFPDNVPGIHGLAVKFELAGGATDLVCQTVPRFSFRDPDEFIAFVRAGGSLLAPVKVAAFAATHPRFVRDLPVNAPALRPLAAYATTRFYGIHAFRWLARDGDGAWVRCDWRPEEGEARLNPLEARRRGRFHLQEGVAERLRDGRPVRWTLDVVLAGPQDDPHDPSARWASERPRFDAGTLELTEAIPDPESDGRVVVFDPMRLTDGIEPSDDPVLRFRPRAYAVSVERRTP